MSKNRDMKGREKAAILLVALGPESVAGTYKYIDDTTIELLTLEIMQLVHLCLYTFKRWSEMSFKLI